MTKSLAVWISRIFHPFVMPVFVLWLVQVLAGLSLVGALVWTSLCVGIVIMPILGFVLWRIKQGQYKDLGVSLREDRYLLYGLGAVLFVVLVGLLFWLDAPDVTRQTTFAATLAFFVAALFNKLVNKVSLHMMGTVAGASLLYFQAPLLGGLFALASLGVAWSRLYLKRHSLSEIILGALIGLVCVVLWVSYL